MIKCFVNAIKGLENSSDTDYRYPFFLRDLIKYAGIQTTFNNSYLNSKFLKVTSRLRITRFHRWVSKIHNKAVVPVQYLEESDIAYYSYVYPVRESALSVCPSVLRVNYQTDRVLKTRKVERIPEKRAKGAAKRRQFRALLTTTRFSVDRFRELNEGYGPEVYYCPNFLPYLRGVRSEELSAPSPSSKVVLLFVGGDGVRKGLHRLVAALNELPRELQQRIELRVISSTEVDYAGGYDCTHLGKQPSSVVMEEMKRADIFVMPTLSDSYGIVFIEAMSQGCAIIADDDLPRKEIVEGNSAGLCIDPWSEHELRAAVERLITDTDYRVACQEAALKAFHEQYAPKVVARRHEDIFNEVIANWDKRRS